MNGFLASDLGDVVAAFLDYPLRAVHRASPPAHVLGGLLDLLFPDSTELRGSAHPRWSITT